MDTWDSFSGPSRRIPGGHRPDAGRLCHVGDGLRIAVVLLIYQTVTYIRKRSIDMACLDTVAKCLLYLFVIDFSLEMLDLVHRMYEANESFRTLDFMVHTKLYVSQIVLQIEIGTLVPIGSPPPLFRW